MTRVSKNGATMYSARTSIPGMTTDHISRWAANQPSGASYKPIGQASSAIRNLRSPSSPAWEPKLHRFRNKIRTILGTSGSVTA